MPTQLLTTKLYIPPVRPNLVPRPRLIERLNEGLDRKLTLISAPAGFGKTTLVSEWINAVVRSRECRFAKGARGKKDRENASPPTPYSDECDTFALPTPSLAWLSLDEGDNDLTRFLTYFIAALNRAEVTETTIGEGALSMLRSPQPPPTEALLTSLINEIAAIPDRIVLVLDDYHLIESAPVEASTSVDGALAFLLEHLPPPERGLHLVIATREDPQLPLARLRARDQLTELRATDLRFSSSEAAEFLNQVMGLDLSTEDITALSTRTESWIAGLQLAAISLQGHTNTSRLIQSFTGSHRLVLAYLIEEVLDRQSQDIQAF